MVPRWKLRLHLVGINAALGTHAFVAVVALTPDCAGMETITAGR